MITKEEMDKLTIFAQEEQPEEKFIYIFGEMVGRHLHNKFTMQYDRDVVKFWASLDLENERKLLAYLNEHYEIKRKDWRAWASTGRTITGHSERYNNTIKVKKHMRKI